MGGPGGATNPEQLFAAGYAACFHSALKMVAKGEGVDIDGSEVSASVSIGTLDAGGFGLAVALDVHAPNLSNAVALAVAEKAHPGCTYSNTTRGHVDLTLSAVSAGGRAARPAHREHGKGGG